MSKIYLVVGNTGEYGDYARWNFKAYLEKEVAIKKCENLNNILKEKRLHRECKDSWGRFEREEEFQEIDPNFRGDYTGSEYDLEEVEIV